MQSDRSTGPLWMAGIGSVSGDLILAQDPQTKPGNHTIKGGMNTQKLSVRALDALVRLGKTSRHYGYSRRELLILLWLSGTQLPFDQSS